ncbi:hypothetical protein ZWY2020_022420 [Hordeum vulgare]|nr:hypothetical protein ZWY2020_022420 [Hordeum vulgare]
MDAALVSVATGALKPVLEKLAALLGDKYRRFKEVRDEIKFLTDELAAMHNFLLKMSEVEDEDPVVQDKAWMNEVRELSYDIEDHLDDFVARVDDDRSAKPDGFMEKIKYLLDRTKARRGIAKAIQSLKKQVVVVGKRHARYATREAISKPSNAMVDPRALAIFKDVSKLVGIDGPKDELIQLLSEPTQQQSRVVSIHGFGGLGKTTLANQMQALEMLKRVRALKQSSNFLRELGQLKNLRKIYLDLFDVPVAGVTKKCCKNSTAYQSLRNLGTQNLRSVTIWNGGSFLLEPWSPTPVGLKKLMTWRSAVAQVPAWVGSLVNLQKLRLEVEGLEPEDLCILGGLPALLTLDLEETTKSSKGKLSVSGGDGFRCLRNLRYNMMLMFTQGCMPRLERINIYLSIAKTESLAGGDIDTYDFGIENLPCLTSIECRVSGTTSVEVPSTLALQAIFLCGDLPELMVWRG